MTDSDLDITMGTMCVQAEPLEGGSFMASGRMWVAPEAETDPRAVAMQGQGLHLPLDALLRRYLPPVSSTLLEEQGKENNNRMKMKWGKNPR